MDFLFYVFSPQGNLREKPWKNKPKGNVLSELNRSVGVSESERELRSSGFTERPHSEGVHLVEGGQRVWSKAWLNQRKPNGSELKSTSFHPSSISQKLCLGLEDVLWVNQEGSCFVCKQTEQLRAQQSEPYLATENKRAVMFACLPTVKQGERALNTGGIN